MSVASFENNAVHRATRGGTQDLFYARDETWPYPRIVRADNVYLYDDEGNRYFDVSSGPVASNLGHNNRRMVEAIKAQAEKLVFAYSRVSRTDENERLADRLAALAGDGFERCFFVSGGSEAIDMAIKFARQRAFARGETKRNRLFSLLPSYHGGTLAAITLSGDLAVENVFRDMVVLPERIDQPLTYRPPEGLTPEQNEDRIAGEFESRIAGIGADHCLALFVEPVGGLASGCNVLSSRFLERLRRICSDAGMLLVFDEVMSGAGRTGRFLTAHYHPGARPDLVVLAKGIGAGYTPLGIMMAPASMVDELSGLGGFNFGHTANANPMACAVGLAALDEIESRDLVRCAAGTGAYLESALRGLIDASPVVGDVRGRGMLLAMEIVADKASRRTFPAGIKAPDIIRRLAFDHGLTIYARRTNNGAFGDWIMITPPLITTREQVDEMVEGLKLTLADFTDHAVRSGTRVA